MITNLHASMTHRERVLAALNHQEPDRLPLALGGGPYGLVDDLYLRLVKDLKLGEPVAPFRTGHNISYMDDRLLERLGTDTRYCWPGLLPNSPVNPGEDENTFYDSYGQVWKRALPYYYAADGLLKDAKEIADIDREVHWPDLSDTRWTAGLEERARRLREQSDYFVIMRMVASHGPFQTACDLRGTVNFLMDMARDPQFAKALLNRVTDTIVGLLRLALQTAGKSFDMIELPGDDYASNTGMLMSPAMFRSYIRPCIERQVKVIKEHDPNLKIMFHSDGAIAGLLPELISLGINVIHPMQPLPVTDLAAVKREFGSQVTFLGGIDISQAMTGTRAEVVEEVKLRIAQLAGGGGYILAPSNHLQADVPVENVLALFESAHEFGKISA